MRQGVLAGTVLALALLAGCTSTAERGDEGAGLPGSGLEGLEGAVTAPEPGSGDSSGQPILGQPPMIDPDCPPPCEFPREAIEDPSSILAQKIVYFDFDQSDLRSEFLELIGAHGRYLATYSDARVRLEGHTDERGSREYNIALGERRAISVRRQLLLQGAASEQIDIVSYGEELPAALGQDEEAWQQNRRVEIVYVQ